MKKENFLKKIKVLSNFLIISVALNVGLIITFSYRALIDSNAYLNTNLKNSKETFFCSYHDLDNVQIENLTNAKCLENFSKLDFNELVQLLNDSEILEDGFSKRDLALGSLVSFYHFDIEKSLLNMKLQVRKFNFLQENGENKIITLFSNLNDYHYESIIHYVSREKWPFTTKGLYNFLKKSKVFPRATSLEEAFFMSSEFMAVRTFFNRDDIFIKHDTLLEMILEAPFDFLENFSNEQKVNRDFCQNKRREFLLNYMTNGSKVAAKIFLQIDFEHSLKRLNDQEVFSLIENLSIESDDEEKFCKKILTSIRADEVLEKAAEKLYSFYGEDFEKPFNLDKALQRFVHLKNTKMTSTVISEVTLIDSKEMENTYIVKQGDSLWKISRKFNISVNELIKKNNMSIDKIIFPGKKIRIPKKINR